MARRKAHRAATPGVVEIRRETKSGTSYGMRWRDLDGRFHKQTFPGGLSQPERDAIMLAKSKALAAHKVAGVISTGQPVAEALAAYFEAKEGGAKPSARTLQSYRRSSDALIAWCAKAGIRSADDLTGVHLIRFRDSLRPKRGQVVYERTIRRRVVETGTVLRWCVKRKLFSQLTRDAVIDFTEQDESYGGKKSTPTEHMPTAEIRKALEAAIKHDDATFMMTRTEKGIGGKHGTPRHEPIAPLTAFYLLTGMRTAEALKIRWEGVDLEAGVIVLRPEDTKTGKGREVTIEEAPALRDLLEAQWEVTGDDEFVFPFSQSHLDRGKKRLQSYGAMPGFTWRRCRTTCQTFLAASTKIYGERSLHRTSVRGGHDIATCEAHYANTIPRGMNQRATTLEGAMKIEDLLVQIIDDLR